MADFTDSLLKSRLGDSINFDKKNTFKKEGVL